MAIGRRETLLPCTELFHIHVLLCHLGRVRQTLSEVDAAHKGSWLAGGMLQMSLQGLKGFSEAVAVP